MTARLIGYARCSRDSQDEQMQIDALLAAGVDLRDIFIDRGISGAKTSRPELDRMLDPETGNLQQGDTLVLFKLDRLGRSSGHVITLLDDLVKRGVNVRTLDGIDTTTSTGRAMLQMLAVFAQMEREFIRERTVAGLASARAQGRVGGRPPKLDDEAIRYARQLLDGDEGWTIAKVAERLKVSRATLYRALELPPVGIDPATIKRTDLAVAAE